MKFPEKMTIREAYGSAMEITDQTEADEYFEALVERAINEGLTREKAEEVQRTNLGYYAGYYDHETRMRVERLFRCQHPIFGDIAKNGPPTAREALLTGVIVGVVAATKDNR